MLGVKRMPRPLSESRKPESRRKTSVCAGHAPATNRFTPRLPRTALRSAGEGGERSETGEGLPRYRSQGDRRRVEEIFQADRQISDPYAGRVVDGVGGCRVGADVAELSQALDAELI